MATFSDLTYLAKRRGSVLMWRRMSRAKSRGDLALRLDSWRMSFRIVRFRVRAMMWATGRAGQRDHVAPGPAVNGCDHASNDGAKADAKGAYFCGLGFFMLRDPVQGF